MNRQAKQLQQKSRKHLVTPDPDGRGFTVMSGASGNVYVITLAENGGMCCTCDWSKYHPKLDCSHTLAVRDWIARGDGKRLSFWQSLEDARRQHRCLSPCTAGLWATARRDQSI